MNLKFKTTEPIGLLVLLLFALMLSNGLYAQSLKKTFKYIKEGEIAKAEIEVQEFTQDKKTSGEDLMLHGLSSSLLLCNEIYKNYDPYKSLELYKTTTEANADKAEVDKFLDKYELSIGKVNELIYQSIFSQAQKINTEASYEKALSVCEVCSYKDEAIKLKEAAAYNEAKNIKSIDGYKYFISSYAKSEHIIEIKNLLYGLAFQDAKSKMSLLSMNDYMKEYSNNENKFVSVATHLRDSIAFSKVNKSYNEYQEFSKQYPLSEYDELIKKELPNMLFEKALSDNNIQTYELFKSNYSSDVRMDSVNRKLERLYLNKLENSVSLFDYRNYKEKYPNSHNNEILKEKYRMIAGNDSLYSKSLTGMPIEGGLNSAFIESIVLDILGNATSMFCILKPPFRVDKFYGNFHVEVNHLKGNVKKIRRESHVYVPTNPSVFLTKLRSFNEFTFDNDGIIKSFFTATIYNDKSSDTLSYDYKVSFLSKNPIKFNSIIETGSYNSYKQINFVCDANGVLQSIIVFKKLGSSDSLTKWEQYFFSYYENGVIVNEAAYPAINAKFISFSKVNSSYPYEIYLNGLFSCRLSKDVDDNYVWSNEYSKNTTYINSNGKLIKDDYWIYNDDSEVSYNNYAKNKYIEFDLFGNWTQRQEYTSDNYSGLTKRYISYY